MIYGPCTSCGRATYLKSFYPVEGRCPVLVCRLCEESEDLVEVQARHEWRKADEELPA